MDADRLTPLSIAQMGDEAALVELLKRALSLHASDMFILPGAPVTVKRDGKMLPLTEERMLPTDTARMIAEIYRIAGTRESASLERTGDDDFSFSLADVSRFRCNAYRQRGTLAAVLRVVPFGLPDPATLHIPPEVMALAEMRRGLVLVTGSAGSGKSTTLACLIDRIDRSRSEHIITIEDPIEFLYPHRQSIVSQREVAHDTETFQTALRASLRQAPDVILLGEMRDYETISTALTAAETGHLLFSTLHTVGAAKTIDRLIDVFPAEQQQQVRVQLSMVLQAVVSQQLLPCAQGGRVPAFEVMRVNRAVRNMIREGKVHQLDNVIFSGASEGMRSMDNDLYRLCREGMITRDDALLYALQPETLEKRL